MTMGPSDNDMRAREILEWPTEESMLMLCCRICGAVVPDGLHQRHYDWHFPAVHDSQT